MTTTSSLLLAQAASRASMFRIWIWGQQITHSSQRPNIKIFESSNNQTSKSSSLWKIKGTFNETFRNEIKGNKAGPLHCGGCMQDHCDAMQSICSLFLHLDRTYSRPDLFVIPQRDGLLLFVHHHPTLPRYIQGRLRNIYREVWKARSPCPEFFCFREGFGEGR